MLTIAHITEEISHQEKYVQLLRIAEKENQPMYVIIKEGVDWSKYQQFPWRKIYYYEYTWELTWALGDILEDYKMFKAIKKVKM